MHKISLATYILIYALITLSTLNAENSIKIGVSAPLTGDASTYGVEMKNVYVLAAEKYGAGKYKLIFEDDRCSGKEAVSAVHKLLNSEKVKYVLGFGCSGAILSAAPILERAKIFTLSPGVSAPSVSNAGDYIFRIWPSEALAIPKLYKYAKRRYKKVVILAEETDYAQAAAQEFVKVSQADSGTAANKIDFLSTETEFRTILLRLASMQPEAVYISAQAEGTLSRIVKQMREGGYNWPLLGMYIPGSKAFLDLVGKHAEEFVYVDMPPAEELLKGSSAHELYQEYIKRFGQPLYGYFVVMTMESFRALDQGLRSGQDLRQYFYKNKFDGLFGPYEFDSNGDIKGLGFVLRVIKNGRPVSFLDEVLVN